MILAFCIFFLVSSYFYQCPSQKGLVSIPENIETIHRSFVFFKEGLNLRRNQLFVWRSGYEGGI